MKIRLGPCRVIFDAEGESPVWFETTKGGVVLEYTEETHELKADQYGETALGEYVIKRSASIQVPFAEYDLEKLSRVIPGATLAVNGSQKRVNIPAGVFDLGAYLKAVVLEPLNTALTGNDRVVIRKAAPRPEISYTYSYDNELITTVTFKAFPDENGFLLIIGDNIIVEQMTTDSAGQSIGLAFGSGLLPTTQLFTTP